jgi:hypothetical protein
MNPLHSAILGIGLWRNPLRDNTYGSEEVEENLGGKFAAIVASNKLDSCSALILHEVQILLEC